MKKIWQKVFLALRWLLLLAIIIMAGLFYLLEMIMDFFSECTSAALGGVKAAGLGAIVKWWASGNIWVTTQLRDILGRYVNKYHLRTYSALRELFRKRKKQKRKRP